MRVVVPAHPEPESPRLDAGVLAAIDQLPLDLLILDRELTVTYANGGALRTAGAGSLLGLSALILTPTSAIPREAFMHALDDQRFHDAIVVRSPGTPDRWFSVDVQPLLTEGVVTGLAVVSVEETAQRRSTMYDSTERRSLEQQIVDVSSRERQAIGRDLHDGLGQELTGVALMLRGLATRLKREAPGSVAKVNEIAALVNQCIGTARALVRGLLPTTDGGGLERALRALVARSGGLYGLKVELRADVSAGPALDEATADHLYRIAQEALSNVARHAQAATVEVALTVTHTGFLLRITDDGVGMPPGAASGGLGLRIMRYRAGMIGATFDLAAHRPHGTVVCVIGRRAVAPVAGGMPEIERAGS